ncbi:c-type cytochrome [Denitrobaculum tricleocarpae]|uniref:c-type cytochrome n=1 Tax=Denitrobaculum tricleocarpae TaxID=2591009 RepID=UPI0015D1877B|nr:cytochrome c [Denitrobaculum tricleocarpae]
MPVSRWILLTGTVFLLSASLLYVAVLPYLGRSDSARDFTAVTGDAERGAYVVRTAGCIACHSDVAKTGGTFAGGSALKTPFGSFYGPNITPDKKHGIGNWSLAQFSRALTDGLSPEGEHYFPSFPYTSYTKLTAQDIADLKAYLDGIEPVARPNRPHDLAWPFSDRKLLGAWKVLYFIAGGFQPDPARSQTWNRGAYLVRAAGHCAECHTERNFLGGFQGSALAGNRHGPDGIAVPAIDALYDHPRQPWSREDLILSLQTGLLPDGDTFDGAMGEVVEHGTSHMTDDDITAIADYLFSGEQRE